MNKLSSNDKLLTKVAIGRVTYLLMLKEYVYMMKCSA